MFTGTLSRKAKRIFIYTAKADYKLVIFRKANIFAGLFVQGK